MTKNLTSRLRAKHAVAFRRMDEKVQAAKSNTSVRLAAGASFAALLCVGRPLAAGMLAAMWLGSTPLTHVAAAGSACAGVLYEAFTQAGDAEETPAKKLPRKPRRRRAKAAPVPTPVVIPAAG